MFNLTPISRGSELRQSSSLVDLTPLAYNDQYKLHLSKTSHELSRVQDMDPTSPPVSPTESLSVLTSSSPSSSSSPTTSTPTPTSSYRSIWKTTKASTGPSLVPRLGSSAASGCRTRRITIHDLLLSPVSQSLAETSAFRQDYTSHSTTMIDSAKRHNRNLSEPNSHIVDEDGDIQLCSPPPITPKQAVWEDTTTSPILGRLVGVPIQPFSYERNERRTATRSASQDEDLAKVRTSQRRETAVISGACPESSAISRSSYKTAQRLRYAPEPQITETSCGREHNPSAVPWKSHSHKFMRRNIPDPPPRLNTIEYNKAQLKNTILHLGIPLVPLVSVSTGLPHPEFPRSILQYHLLTHDQLDSLAHWYHQAIDNQHERFMYPATIEQPWVWSDSRLQAIARESMSRYTIVNAAQELTPDLATKRRRFGRFIGLRGCETPVLSQAGDEGVSEEDTETLSERMEREWRAALRKAEEEEKLQEKMWRGRW